MFANAAFVVFSALSLRFNRQFYLFPSFNMNHDASNEYSL